MKQNRDSVHNRNETKVAQRERDKRRGTEQKKNKEVGMKIGRSAVAALIQPPSLFFSLRLWSCS